MLNIKNLLAGFELISEPYEWKLVLNLETNLDTLRLQVQNYACLGCSNCSALTNQDLRSKRGVLIYLVAKRSCYLGKLEKRINQLMEQKEKVKGEIESYQEVLNTLQPRSN